MITEIPTAEDFRRAGLNQLYLAWQIIMRTTREFEELEGLADHMDDQERAEAQSQYWTSAQPVLANALGLIQQSMEMAIKGKIAGVSPYLLISRDPKDWPKRSDRVDVPFSEFRSVDAADLVKVHNTFVEISFDDEFQRFWEKVRRDRNKVMHSVARLTFEPGVIIKHILFAAYSLYGDRPWPTHICEFDDSGVYTIYGVDEGWNRNGLMEQVERALGYLTPSEAYRLLAFKKQQRAYVCPPCYENSNRDAADHWPALAQLRSREATETILHCVVCNEHTVVERKRCRKPGCCGNVIGLGMCLTCLAED